MLLPKGNEGDFPRLPETHPGTPGTGTPGHDQGHAMDLILPGNVRVHHPDQVGEWPDLPIVGVSGQQQVHTGCRRRFRHHRAYGKGEWSDRPARRSTLPRYPSHPIRSGIGKRAGRSFRPRPGHQYDAKA